MKSLLWKIWFLFFMLICMLCFFLLMLGKLILPRKAYRPVVGVFTRFWGRTTVLSTGSKVTVSGSEHLPEHDRVCFVSNHQGMFDIPLVLGFVGKSSGFIAKKELLKVPVLSWWMREMHCAFIDRGSARKAIESFAKSAEVIKAGNPMVIFPEGTRSRGDEMRAFRAGSFKLPVMAGATIVPLAIKDTWRMHEIDKGIHAVPISLKILEPIEPEEALYRDRNALSKELHERISAALKNEA